MLDTRVQLPSFSMWTATPVYEVPLNGENVVVFGLRQESVVPDPSDAVYVMPKALEFRLDLISQTAYGVPDLWWVLASVNGIVDPLAGVAAGTVLRVPAKSRLAQEGLLSV